MGGWQEGRRAAQAGKLNEGRPQRQRQYTPAASARSAACSTETVPPRARSRARRGPAAKRWRAAGRGRRWGRWPRGTLLPPAGMSAGGAADGARCGWRSLVHARPSCGIPASQPYRPPPHLSEFVIIKARLADVPHAPSACRIRSHAAAAAQRRRGGVPLQQPPQHLLVLWSQNHLAVCLRRPGQVGIKGWQVGPHSWAGGRLAAQLRPAPVARWQVEAELTARASCLARTCVSASIKCRSGNVASVELLPHHRCRERRRWRGRQGAASGQHRELGAQRGDAHKHQDDGRPPAHAARERARRGAWVEARREWRAHGAGRWRLQVTGDVVRVVINALLKPTRAWPPPLRPSRHRRRRRRRHMPRRRGLRSPAGLQPMACYVPSGLITARSLHWLHMSIAEADTLCERWRQRGASHCGGTCVRLYASDL